MRHRDEIDGLRALAVIPVVLFHAGLAGFDGGYVGVDVFFVISGYLITGILLAEHAAGSFVLARFYERRARRILPAHFLVMLVCGPMAAWWMTPEQLTSFGKSVVAASLFVSNFCFYDAAGYFEGPGELQPLLHTWSLAIEEQFYLLFPLLLMVAWRRARVHQLLLALLGASLVVAQLENRRAPDMAFFLLPARAWELMLGSWLAWRESCRGPAAGNDLLSFAGLALFGLAVATFESDTPHPGIWTLMPTAGAALVIAFGREAGIVHRLLVSRVLVGIGLVSYSLYLWHQPILALARVGSLTAPSASENLSLLALAGVLSWFSWRFVEAPFRDPGRVPIRWVWRTVGVGTGLSVVVGSVLWFSAGLPQRLDPRVLQPIEDARSHANQVLARDGELCADRPADRACVLGAGVAPTWALVGDSTAGSLSIAFDERLSALGESGIQLTRSGCLYLPGFRRRDGRNCPELSFAARERLRDPRIRRVILAGRYAFMLTETRFDNGEGGRELGPPRGVVPAKAQAMTAAERESVVLAGYRDSVRDLIADGKTVYLVYPIPEVGWNVPDQLFKLRALRHVDAPVTTSDAIFRERTARVVAAFDALGAVPRLIRRRPADLWCNTVIPGRCVTELGGEILYADDNHLSLAGARRVIQVVMARPEDRRESRRRLLGHLETAGTRMDDCHRQIHRPLIEAQGLELPEVLPQAGSRFVPPNERARIRPLPNRPTCGRITRAAADQLRPANPVRGIVPATTAAAAAKRSGGLQPATNGANTPR